MTMCHAIEARVPFLDTQVIEAAQTVPPKLKLYAGSSGQCIEKWVLRKAFADLLPRGIVWRDKQQFDEGSGMVELLPSILDRAASGIDTKGYAARFAADRLRSKEECFYHSLLMKQFEQPQAVLANMGRWQLDQDQETVQ
jgi:asparagine synthase (glutamine-hydrolysing)